MSNLSPLPAPEQNSTVSPAREGPIAQFGQFVDGRLILKKARTTELEYVAISHVWGKIECITDIPNVDGEVLASRSKATFIEKKLPGLVGEKFFWMDTLTINQRNQAEVIATAQIIPTIFRDAIRTIAIREGGGIYQCCAHAVRGFADWKAFQQKIFNHSEEHLYHALDESYLQRLWTLQECLLSHTIEFVIDTPEQPEEVTSRPDFYRHQTEIERVCDSLYVLAQSFADAEGLEGIEKFIRAYVDGGTVQRAKLPERDKTEDIHTNLFRETHLASHRCASKPRDYILATMPQFPWYHCPLEAKQMEFSDIFMDLYKQASREGHAFACRITQSMMDPRATENSWLPSAEQPEPKSLGDFLKLLGQRLPDRNPDGPDNIHLTTTVNIMEIPDNPNTVLDLVESAMHFSERKWQESHKGGELSKFGSFPKTEWELNGIDAMRSGWIPKDGQWAQENFRVIEDGDETIMMFGRFQEYEEDPLEELMMGIFGDNDNDEPHEYVTLYEQSRMILDHMWCGLDRSLNPAQASDWRSFRRDMRGAWCKPLLQMILLQAALVSCGIGLSATTWMRRRFVPVCVKYSNVNLLGLLAKHARSEEPRGMYSVGRHLDRTSFGKDLVLVDPTTKLAVGLLPDFLPLIRTDEQYIERLRILYNGLMEPIGPGRAAFAAMPLDKLPEVKENKLFE